MIRGGSGLRILMIGDGFKPAIGGAETVSYELGKRLAKRGHSVTVLTRRIDSAWPEREIVDGIAVQRYDDPLPPRPIVYFAADYPAIVRARRAVDALLAGRSFDVVVMHPVVSPLGACRSRRARDIPKVFVFYAPFHLELEAEFGNRAGGREAFPLLRRVLLGLKVAEKKRQQREMMSRSSQVMVFSEFSRQLAKDLLPALPDHQLRRLPIGVDTAVFRPFAGDRAVLRQGLGLERGQFILFTLRRLAARMGLDNLIRAMPAVLAEVGKAHLVIGGEGPLRPALQALVGQLGLERCVQFAGRLENEEVVQYLQAADLFVLPTRSLEGIGLPTLESLASGLPVLGTPVGATPEILGKLSPDLLTRDGEPDAIAGGIVGFVRSFGRDNHELQARCRQLAESEYAWPKAVDEFERLLHNVVNAPAADRSV